MNRSCAMHVDTKNVINVNEGAFDKVIAKGVTLVDFWAEWCGPCRMQGPILEKLAPQTEEHVKIAKLNVDENPSIASRFGVMSIPTLILYKNGEVFKQFVGVQNEAVLKQAIEEAG